MFIGEMGLRMSEAGASKRTAVTAKAHTRGIDEAAVGALLSHVKIL
jgi:hypothetical protein